MCFMICFVTVSLYFLFPFFCFMNLFYLCKNSTDHRVIFRATDTMQNPKTYKNTANHFSKDFKKIKRNIGLLAVRPRIYILTTYSVYIPGQAKVQISHFCPLRDHVIKTEEFIHILFIRHLCGELPKLKSHLICRSLIAILLICNIMKCLYFISQYFLVFDFPQRYNTLHYFAEV